MRRMLLKWRDAGRAKTYLSPATSSRRWGMTTDHIGPGSGVARDYFYYPGERLLVLAMVSASAPIPAFAVAARRRLSLGEIKWDGANRCLFRGRSGTGHVFRCDARTAPIRAAMHVQGKNA